MLSEVLRFLLTLFLRGGDTRHSAVYDVYPGTDVYDLLRTHSNAIKARPRMS